MCIYFRAIMLPASTADRRAWNLDQCGRRVRNAVTTSYSSCMGQKLQFVNALLYPAAAGILAACSGGGGGSPGQPPSPPSNAAPTMTSSSTASVPENSSGVVYTATATDPDGDTLSFSISGSDAGRLTINSASGAVSFASPPDFEAPTDANSDNTYTFTLTVRDPAGASDSQTVSISVTDVSESGQRYVDHIFASVDVQRAITFAPGLSMDVFTPSGDTATNRPVLILAAGGGFVGQVRTAVEPIARDFARRGYVTASIDYRVLASPPLTADELAVAAATATHDMFAAVRFFRADALAGNSNGIRADAIFVGGESAGGVLAAIAATLDPSDTISSSAIANYYATNGGVYGNVGSQTGTPSAVNGAMILSGAILDLATVDAASAVLYAAHEEFDSIVPCQTAAEGANFTGLVVSGACDLVPAYTSAGASAELFLVAGSAGHVNYSNAELASIYQGAATLFFNQVISTP